jgi:hypothetical protein
VKKIKLKMKPFLLTIGFFIFFAGCSQTNEIEEVQSLSTGEFTLSIDRVANPVSISAIQFPADELQEFHYIKLTEVKVYDVVFSENGQRVTISPNAIPNITGSMIGIREQSSSNKEYFNFISGTFAGGRFVVWNENKKLHCELTINGSGVPIILSERGILVNK